MLVFTYETKHRSFFILALWIIDAGKAHHTDLVMLPIYEKFAKISRARASQVKSRCVIK